jgi:hypothetical protein
MLGWGLSTRDAGRTLVIANDRLQNLYRDPVGAPELGFYPLIGFNPGWLPDFLLDIIPCADTSTYEEVA